MPIAVFAILSFSVLSLRTPLFVNSNKKLDLTKNPSSLVKISIVIPARNEEKRISNLLESISHQSLAPFEVIVVDDESNDGTAVIARKYGCEVLKVEGRPANLAPKPFVCHLGYSQSSGDVILFLDADTVLSQDFVERVTLHFCEKENKVLSIQPFSRTKTFLQSTAMFFHLSSIVGSGLLSMVRFQVGVFGPCVAIRREVYEAVGGFSEKRVSKSLIEDVELGELLKDHKINVARYLGTGAIEYDMYPDLKTMALGWKKNISQGASKAPVFVLLSIIAVIGSMIAIPVALVTSFESNSTTLFLILQFLIIWLLVVNVAVRLGNYLRASILYPISIAVFLYVFGLSMISTLFKQNVKWAGRSLSRNFENK